MSAALWKHVARGEPDACWPWTGATDPKGYGKVRVDGKTRLAHRVAYELGHGKTPGPCVMHKCDNPPCCNPAHLVDGTVVLNNADCIAKGRLRAGIRESAKTHCPNGHAYDEANTYVDPRGFRGCRTCRDEAVKRYKARRNESCQTV
jgi:hypothetical protein